MKTYELAGGRRANPADEAVLKRALKGGSRSAPAPLHSGNNADTWLTTACENRTDDIVELRFNRCERLE